MRLKKMNLDKWLEKVAEESCITGGQGRSGAAILFSALVMFGGICMEIFICICILLAEIFGKLN